MNKNIKLFSTDSDRTTYESSASYETPYVSKVAADNSVHYNKPIPTTVFWKFSRGSSGYVFGSFLEGDSIEMDTSGPDQAYLADNSGKVSLTRAYVNQALKDSILSAVKNTFGIEFDTVATVFKYYSAGGTVLNWANYREITKPPLITFTIDGDEFQAEQGTTWGEWVNSEYNTEGFIIEPDCDNRVMTSDLLYDISHNNSYDTLYNSDIITTEAYRTVVTDCSF